MLINSYFWMKRDIEVLCYTYSFSTSFIIRSFNLIYFYDTVHSTEAIKNELGTLT